MQHSGDANTEVTFGEVMRAYETITNAMHPTEPIGFGVEAVRKALEEFLRG